MIEPRDFSYQEHFPGEHGNPFDVILHRLEDFQKIPVLFLLLILAGLAFLCAQFVPSLAVLMFLFFLGDWCLLLCLPRLDLSYGPEKAIVLILALLRAPFALLPTPANLGFQIIGILLVLYAFYIEPFRLTISYQKLETPKLTQNSTLRILHLGDLHIERITKREKAILKSISESSPDLILFSGDIINLSYLNEPQAHNEAREFLSQLKAQLGVYLVSGSSAVDLPELLPEILEGLSIHWLQDQAVTICKGTQSINILGLTCSHRPHKDSIILENLVKQTQPQNPTILLYHSPDLAPHAAKLNIDLQLSGHTHGGQFRLPWVGALYAGSLYGRLFQSGRYKLNKMVLYITRGIGMEGAAAPRMRFLCPPEIIYWDITPKNPHQEQIHEPSSRANN